MPPSRNKDVDLQGNGSWIAFVDGDDETPTRKSQEAACAITVDDGEGCHWRLYYQSRG